MVKVLSDGNNNHSPLVFKNFQKDGIAKHTRFVLHSRPVIQNDLPQPLFYETFVFAEVRQYKRHEMIS